MMNEHAHLEQSHETATERMRSLEADLHRVTTELTQLQRDVSDYPELLDDPTADGLRETLMQAHAAITEAIAKLREDNEMTSAVDVAA